MQEDGEGVDLDDNPIFVNTRETFLHYFFHILKQFASGRNLASGLSARKPLFVSCVKPQVNSDLSFQSKP